MSPKPMLMNAIAAFVRLTRPKFLLGGFAGFGLGVAVAVYAGANVALGTYLGGQLMVTAFHLMTHYGNDYFDRDADRFTQPSAFAGGSGVLVAGALPASVALAAALVSGGCGLLAAAAFAARGNTATAILGGAIGILSLVVFGAAAALVCPRLGGELLTAVVVGVLVPLAGYAASTGRIDALAVAATLGPACAMFAMMIGVEWPDRSADAAAGKRNLVVRRGARMAAKLALAAVGSATLGFVAAIAAGGPWTLAVAALILVAPAARFARRIADPRADPAAVAAAGVLVFFLTVVLALFAYIAAPHEKLTATLVVANPQRAG